MHVYTSRTLTFPSNKLLAISAIAEKYGIVFNNDYLAGLWRFSLPISLVRSANPRNPYKIVDRLLLRCNIVRN